MKRLIFTLSAGLLIACLAGCAAIWPKSKVDSSTGVPGLSPYAGPKARIAITDFEVKAAKAGGQVGTGLKEMLLTALTSSNRFSVLDRQSLKQVIQEQQISALEASQQGEDAQKSQIKTVELVVTTTVTEFCPPASGGMGGIGAGGGVGSGILGGLLGGSQNKAYMVLDIEVIDTSSSEVIASTRVRGEATDIAGGSMAGFFGDWALGSGLGGYANTPMEKAIRICIIEAVKYISQTIPVNYYKY